MADDTNPVTTPSGQPPAQAADGTLLNQAAIAPTPADSSLTTPPTEPKKVEPSTPDPTKTALNNDAKPPEGAPEKYSDFKLPEGLKLQPEALAEATTVFKGLNLSQDEAQSLIDFHAKQISAVTDAPFKAVTDLKTNWESSLKSTYGKDIEPGGKVITSISRMIDTLPPTIASGFREAMDLTLAGSNPAFVAAFYELSQRLAEGKSVKGNGPSPGGQAAPNAAPKSVAQAMYPHLKSANDTQS
jgi:hypothetical protein